MKLTPLMKFAMFYTAGIVSGKYLNLNLMELAAIFSAGLAILIILLLAKSSKIIQLIFCYSLVMVAGFCNSLITFQKINELSLPFKDIKNAEVFCEIEEVLLENEGALRFIVKTDSVKTDKDIKYNKIAALLKVKSNSKRLDDLYLNARIGDKLIFIGDITEPPDCRNPGAFDYKSYLAQKGISAIGFSKLEKLKLLKQSETSLGNVFIQSRISIDNRIKLLHSEKTAGFLRGILLADRSDIEQNIKESFINSGIVHILAVSGLHVGYIILIFYLFTARLNVHLRIIFILTGLILFLVITGMPVSAARASLMAALLLAAGYFDRNYSPMNSLFLAALLILIYDPSELYTAGFQLSVSAVFSIIYFYPLFKEWLKTTRIQNKYLRTLILFMSISFFAQLGTLPFTVIYFHKISIVSLLANLFAIPLVGVIIANSFFTIIISLLSLNIATSFAAVTNLLTDLLYNWGEFLGSLEFSYFSYAGFNLVEGAIYLLVVFTSFKLLLDKYPVKFKLFVTLISAFTITLIFSISSNKILEDGNLSVLTVDVGQGDSFLVKFPNGKSALIDAGNATNNYDCGKSTIKPLLEYLNIKKLDYIFISHIDADHYKGALSLIEDNLTDTVYIPLVDSNSTKEVSFNIYLSKKHDVVKYYQKSSLSLGNSKIYFLMCSKISSFNSNNRSGILKICYGNTSALFMGDAEIKVEKQLITEYKNFLDSDLLKVGHHGSRHGTGKPFLQWVTPEYSIISAGKNNSYNHPNNDVLDNLIESGSTIFRTDKEGAILMVSDGRKFIKKDWRNF